MKKSSCLRVFVSSWFLYGCGLLPRRIEHFFAGENGETQLAVGRNWISRKVAKAQRNSLESYALCGEFLMGIITR